MHVNGEQCNNGTHFSRSVILRPLSCCSPCLDACEEKCVATLSHRTYAKHHTGSAMLRVIAQSTTTCADEHFRVFLRHSKRPVLVSPLDSSSESNRSARLLHVTDVEADDEAACRMLDRLARQAFVAQPYQIGIHVLQAPAGSGKTQCNIALATRMADEGKSPLLLTYNKAARADGARRTAADPRLAWRTIDSMVSAVIGEEQRGEGPEVDLQRSSAVQALACRILQRAVDSDEASMLREELNAAVTTGSCSAGSADCKTLFEAGLQGRWWCYAMLRVRAVLHSGWEGVMADYDVILVDEAQDMCQQMIALLKRLHGTKMIVYTRDKAQQIYSFLGCEDIVRHLLPDQYRAWNLYTTFRHGQAVCALVNEQGLPVLPTYAAEGAPETAIIRVPAATALQCGHTLLLCTWAEILLQADSLMNAGRTVCLDSDKREELLTRAQAPDAEDSLFKRLNPAFVTDIVQRTLPQTLRGASAEPSDSDAEASDAEASNAVGSETGHSDAAPSGGGAADLANAIFISTVHSFKGCEAAVIRLGPCVLKHSCKELRYVAYTRASTVLVLPQGKRKGRRPL